MRYVKDKMEDAKKKSDAFVREQFKKAKQLLKEGKTDEAYWEFGIGLHTLQDATSTAHGGFQSWTGHESFWQLVKHVWPERNYPGPNSNLQKITNKYIDWFENSDEPLPGGNLLDRIQHD